MFPLLLLMLNDAMMIHKKPISGRKKQAAGFDLKLYEFPEKISISVWGTTNKDLCRHGMSFVGRVGTLVLTPLWAATGRRENKYFLLSSHSSIARRRHRSLCYVRRYGIDTRCPLTFSSPSPYAFVNRYSYPYPTPLRPLYGKRGQPK